MTAFYNEIDPFAAQWLRNLIDAGHIAPGIVDERSIEDIHPEELHGFTQCHFFAGIGAWSLALRLAGWPDDEPVWTGSCPCQPFSSAGKGAGFADERHLWPAFHHLISERRPPVVFGEQVAGPDGLRWLDLVHADLENARYAFGAADLCAAGVGAPHIRQRLYWVADAADFGQHGWGAGEAGHGRGAARVEPQRLRDAGRMGDTEGVGQQRRPIRAENGLPTHGVAENGRAGRMGDASSLGHGGGGADGVDQQSEVPWARPEAADPGPTNGHWRDADWLYCRDARWRPVEPGAFPLAHGAPARVGRLRAYGNAVVPQVAQAFVEAYLQTRVTA